MRRKGRSMEKTAKEWRLEGSNKIYMKENPTPGYECEDSKEKGLLMGLLMREGEGEGEGVYK